MGKSTKQLIKAVNDSYTEINNRKHHTDIVPIESDIDEDEKETSDERLHRLSDIITNELITFTETNAYPLCEFLHNDEIYTFFKWVTTL
jgi:hypothetical protein